MQLSFTTSRFRIWLVVLAIGVALAIGSGALIAFGSPLYALVGALGLIAAAIVMSNIDLGLYGVIAVAVLLPFGALPLNIGFNPTFLDLALIAVFTMWLARIMTRQNDQGFDPSPIGLPVLTFFILAIFSFVAGLGFAPVTSQIMRQFAEVLISIAFFFVIVNAVQTREMLGRMVTALIIAGFISAALGIVFYFLPQTITIQILSALRVFKYPTDGILRFIEDDPANPMRAISTSVDPNVLGGLMILVTALTAPQIFANKPLLPRNWIIVMWTTMAVCLILTFSRSAFIGLGLALAVIATVRYRPIVAVMLLAAVVLFFAPFTQEYLSHLGDAFTFSDRASQMRLGEYKDAFILISRYPLFGVGFGGSPDIDTYLGVSSVYLLMAEEMGLLGLGTFLIIMGLFFYNVVQSWFARISNDTFLAPILLGLAGALLGAMIGGLADHYFFNLRFIHAVVLFWLFVALGMVTIRLGTENQADEKI